MIIHITDPYLNDVNFLGLIDGIEKLILYLSKKL